MDVGEDQLPPRCDHGFTAREISAGGFLPRDHGLSRHNCRDVVPGGGLSDDPEITGLELGKIDEISPNSFP